MDKLISIETIKEQCIEWAKSFLGESFVFRKHQLETISENVYNIVNGINRTQIVQAPTGSGKSIVLIIESGVLCDYYNKKSYILASDLFLWKQYEDFIKKNKKLREKIGILKGQTGNYNCSINGEDMRNADCRMAQIPWGSLFNNKTADDLGYDCAKTCKYVQQRKHALKSDITLMTYALYHFMINVVPKMVNSNKSSLFTKRDIIFCDECHNIPQIISLEFHPTIKEPYLNNFKLLYSYRSGESDDLFDDKEYEGLISKNRTLEWVVSEFNDIFYSLLDKSASNYQDLNSINRYIRYFEEFSDTVDCIEIDLANKKSCKVPYSSNDIKYYKAVSWYRNMNCIFSDFSECIDSIGIDYVIKGIDIDNRDNTNLITFSVVKEDYIVYKYLLNTAEYRVLTSATVGGYDAFYDNNGIGILEDSEEIPATFINVPSTFDFSKSPIYYYNKYSLAYKVKDKNFPIIKEIIYKLCSGKYQNMKGIILTGSYADAKNIYNNAPVELQNRLILYNNSKDKTAAIASYRFSTNGILLGPTLTEGIDLPGEQCRFIIISKVPYPNIADQYTKKKMELFPKWYASQSAMSIIQGIGRGVRFDGDYCDTYILDACFLSLFNNTKDSQWTQELQDRIRIFN